MQNLRRKIEMYKDCPTYQESNEEHDVNCSYDIGYQCNYLDPTKLYIDHKGTFYSIWRPFINNMCFISSFSYAHFAAFKHASSDNHFLICGVEFIFLLDFFFNFFLDYQDVLKLHTYSIRDHEKIGKRYFQGNFKVDVVALLPFQYLTLSR
jgi:hypothetical protein